MGAAADQHPKSGTHPGNGMRWEGHEMASVRIGPVSTSSPSSWEPQLHPLKIEKWAVPPALESTSLCTGASLLRLGSQTETSSRPEPGWASQHINATREPVFSAALRCPVPTSVPAAAPWLLESRLPTGWPHLFWGHSGCEFPPRSTRQCKECRIGRWVVTGCLLRKSPSRAFSRRFKKEAEGGALLSPADAGAQTSELGRAKFNSGLPNETSLGPTQILPLQIGLTGPTAPRTWAPAQRLAAVTVAAAAPPFSKCCSRVPEVTGCPHSPRPGTAQPFPSYIRAAFTVPRAKGQIANQIIYCCCWLSEEKIPEGQSVTLRSRRPDLARHLPKWNTDSKANTKAESVLRAPGLLLCLLLSGDDAQSSCFSPSPRRCLALSAHIESSLPIPAILFIKASLLPSMGPGTVHSGLAVCVFPP
ncbi:hypothetical protein Cadr_000020899 [Camelus dromedarius]|uniref:Uncharacterized protein n=1 Tax=Camelus dromedarius TaxID=9838 RepID=A0A5N4CTI9_CAMDR|nr:hypothetical protein Cadr_000020899 [Camelus dromedarius]